MIGLTRKLWGIRNRSKCPGVLHPWTPTHWLLKPRYAPPETATKWSTDSQRPAWRGIIEYIEIFFLIPDGSFRLWVFLNTSKYTAWIPSQTLFSWWSSLVLGYITPHETIDLAWLLIGRLRCKVPSWPLPSAKEHQLGRLQHEHLQGKKCCETRNDKETINLGSALLQLFQYKLIQIEIAVLN